MTKEEKYETYEINEPKNPFRYEIPNKTRIKNND